MKRRNFIRSAAIAAAGAAASPALAEKIHGAGQQFHLGNKPSPPAHGSPSPSMLPRWKGFNLLDYFSPNAGRRSNEASTTDDDLKWMADWGFNFVRLPMAYPRYLSFDREKPFTPDTVYNIDTQVVDEVEQLVERANRLQLHVSLNLHRAPGYCINAGFKEPYNLWKDKEAQVAFAFHWRMWADRFKNLPPEKISFDLLNEPAYREDMNDQFSKSSALDGVLYRQVAAQAVDSIRQANPNHLIIADGNQVGNLPTPELNDLHVGQSCRGYFPHYISHYRANWVWKDPNQSPDPVWPGVMDGREFGRKQLEDYYAPWIALKNGGVGVHCGECGCYSLTPHEVFLSWFEDVLDILTGAGIGYALWNFRGSFGLLNSGRKDVDYADWNGHQLDSKLLSLLKKY